MWSTYRVSSIIAQNNTACSSQDSFAYNESLHSLTIVVAYLNANQQGKLDQQITIRTTLMAQKLPQEQRLQSKGFSVKTESACLDSRSSLEDTQLTMLNGATVSFLRLFCVVV